MSVLRRRGGSARPVTRTASRIGIVGSAAAVLVVAVSALRLRSERGDSARAPEVATDARPAPGTSETEAPARPQLRRAMTPPDLTDEAWGAIGQAAIADAFARCHAAFPVDCSDYAQMLLQHAGETERAAAEELNDAACRADPANRSCATIAWRRIGQDDVGGAIQVADRACRAGNREMCTLLAEHAPWLAPESARIVREEPPDGDALRTLGLQRNDSACQAGDLAACRDRDLALIQSTSPLDVLLGMSRMRAACDASDGVACLLAALPLAETRPAEARPLLDRACVLGRADGCEHRDLIDGVMSSPNAPQDRNALNDAQVTAAQADRYLRANESCSRGDASSCEEAAFAQLQGIGTARDPASAINALEQLCSGGRASACGMIAFAAEAECQGGGSCDAVRLHERACSLGHRDSCEAAARLRESDSTDTHER